VTTTPPQPPQNPYPGQPGPGYGPPQEQFPQYNQPVPPQGQPQGPPQFNQQPGQPFAPPPAQYGQPQFGQQGVQGQPQFMPPAFDNSICRFCGSVPAVQATVRGHQGLLIMMRFLKLEGPFCRSCGIATYRDMTAKSLWQGWWGIGSMIINPITMLVNLPTRAKFGKLPEPAPGAPGQPMDVGKPLFKRPAIIMLLIPFALIALIVYGASQSTSNASAGDCVQNTGSASSPNVSVVDCSSSDAEYKIIGKISGSANADDCAAQYPDYTVAYSEERGSSKYTLCLVPN